MLGTVCIPVFSRPAFLKICLEYILQADQCERFQFIFCIDNGYDQRILPIIKAFPLTKAQSIRTYKVIGGGKQSENVLTGLQNACQFNKPVFYIEDDIFIGKDFFTFGLELIKKEPKILCAILSKNNNVNDNPPENINGYYIKKNTDNYQSLGSIFNPDMFMKYVAPHNIPDYVFRQIQYISHVFPHSQLEKSYAEQDGLIRRIIEKEKLQVAFSCVPRCFHAGFWGYNRHFALNIQKMPIAKQIEMIKQIAFDPEQLRDIVRQYHLVQDSLPCNLNTQHKTVEKINL